MGTNPLAASTLPIFGYLGGNRLGTTVLLVEDDPGVVEIARTYLAHDGHNVLVANDGLEGLRLARENDPDLLVLDLMLPKA